MFTCLIVVRAESFVFVFLNFLKFFADTTFVSETKFAIFLAPFPQKLIATKWACTLWSEKNTANNFLL